MYQVANMRLTSFLYSLVHLPSSPSPKIASHSLIHSILTQKSWGITIFQSPNPLLPGWTSSLEASSHLFDHKVSGDTLVPIVSEEKDVSNDTSIVMVGVIVMVVMVVVGTVEGLEGALVVGRVVLLPWVTYKFNLHLYHRFKIETYWEQYQTSPLKRNKKGTF